MKKLILSKFQYDYVVRCGFVVQGRRCQYLTNKEILPASFVKIKLPALSGMKLLNRIICPKHVKLLHRFVED